MTDTTDSVLFHLWLAVQLCIDLATSVCIDFKLGTPNNYADAFRRLAAAGHLDRALAERLALATGFRNAVAHGYEKLDLARAYQAAVEGPADLRAFLAGVARMIRA